MVTLEGLYSGISSRFAFETETIKIVCEGDRREDFGGKILTPFSKVAFLSLCLNTDIERQ